MQQNQTFTKKISVTNLNSQAITAPPGAAWKSFTVYKIYGNDGIVYETTDQQYYAARKVGEVIDITYYVESKPGRNGQIFSHYKLVLPKKQDLTMQGMMKIYARMEQMEKNILAAIEAHKPSAPVAVPVVQVAEAVEEEELPPPPEAPEEGEAELGPDDLPF